MLDADDPLQVSWRQISSMSDESKQPVFVWQRHCIVYNLVSLSLRQFHNVSDQMMIVCSVH